MARLFISQERLDNWAVEDRIKVDGDVMTLQGDGRSFKLEPAIRFLKIAGPGDDAGQLLGKVKTLKAVQKLGGEQYMESVLLGDIAYDVQTGFIGEPIEEG